MAVTRRPEIELLRVVACAGVVLLHALLIFAPEPLYHLKSGVASPLAGVLAEALRVTTMPVFFLLAGWSAVAALRRRGVWGFLRERRRRLLVPLLSGMVLLCPFIKYIELRGGRDLAPGGFRLVTPTRWTLWEFLPHFFTQVRFATWSHLWFLVYLLVLSVLLLPVLRYLARLAPSARVPGAGWVYLPALVLALWLVLVRGYWPYYPTLYRDWGNMAYYGLIMLAGGGIAAWRGAEVALRRHWPGLLVLGGLGFVVVAGYGESMVGRVGVGLLAWGAAAGALGLAGRYPPAGGAWLERLGRAALPVYVLHHLPLLLIGLVTLRSGLPWAVQVPVIWLGALAVALLTTRLLVAPWRPGRVLLGMPAVG
jgi:peptidoglycan/LPS O-acetylase OafA/YrhL